ncbi:hypothetical protein [Streptosporangium canum]|uniref:hypothetical protein n=1 Tax=Streptosporangium canum TaxID=324952 RepID=UPI003796D74E
MSTPSSAGPQWSGDMLDRPEMVEAFSDQLRAALVEYVDYVARIRRDAEAMWRANPPSEYGSFEAWWRHHKVTAPFAKLQEHLEDAVKLTFEVAAQHRRQRHELPATRKAAVEARQEAAALSRGHSAPRLSGGGQPYPKPRRAAPAADDDGSFLDMVSRERSA